MSNSKHNAKANANHNNYNLGDYTQDTPVKITRGYLKGCTGKILGCTNDGIYFISGYRCSKKLDYTTNPIGLFLPDEFELLN